MVSAASPSISYSPFMTLAQSAGSAPQTPGIAPQTPGSQSMGQPLGQSSGQQPIDLAQLLSSAPMSQGPTSTPSQGLQSAQPSVGDAQQSMDITSLLSQSAQSKPSPTNSPEIDWAGYFAQMQGAQSFPSSDANQTGATGQGSQAIGMNGLTTQSPSQLELSQAGLPGTTTGNPTANPTGTQPPKMGEDNYAYNGTSTQTGADQQVVSSEDPNHDPNQGPDGSYSNTPTGLRPQYVNDSPPAYSINNPDSTDQTSYGAPAA